MLNEFINFETISRSDWQRFYQEDQVSLTPEELESIRSLNDKIDVQEVRDIYLPLINLIRIYHRAAEVHTFYKRYFCKKHRLTDLLLLVSQVLLQSENQQLVAFCNYFFKEPSLRRRLIW